MPAYLGIDTSNYTTSVAVFDGERGVNESRLLEVRPGELGLRQSDVLFQHVKRLPELFTHLRKQGLLEKISAVAASTRPRAVEGSYMPCFLAGEGLGRAIADTLGVPFYVVSHQQGHLAAAAWSAGRMELLDEPFLAWHLSGGTTELLYCDPDGSNVRTTCIGGTSDISAGQLIDRTGILLGLAFPAGKALDELASTSDSKEQFEVKVREKVFSLSGVENKVKTMLASDVAKKDVAHFTLATVTSAVHRATVQAQNQYPGRPLICSGGVASNRSLRYCLTEFCGAFFAEPCYSTDNALGVAILAHRLFGGEA